MEKISKYVVFVLIFIGLALAGGGQTFASVLTVTENPSPIFPASTRLPDQGYVLKDDTNYKLYYADCTIPLWVCSIDLAQSPDGVTWTPYVGNPVLAEGATQGEHADVHFYSAGFTGANSGTNPSAITMYYRMWYQGTAGGIGDWRYAESPDGITWYNHIAVTQTGTSVTGGISANYGIADAVYTPGGEGGDASKTFRMYINVQYAVAPYTSNELVIMAYSQNGYVWTGYDPTSVGHATPVFAPTLDGVSFDTDHVGWFKVIKNSDTDWEAFYSGGKNSTYVALNGIGYARSRDGINWVRRQTLFTTNDSVAWRNQSVWMPSVVKSGNNYKIFFLGSDDESDGSWIWWKLGGADMVKETTPPTVASVDPAGATTNISPGRSINVTFSEEMDSATITTSTFTLKKGATPIAGTVSYSGLKATFIPNATLDSNSVYTAKISTGAEDIAGNALTADYTWNFTTGWNYHDWTDQGLNYTAPSGSAYYPSVIYDANGFGTGTPEYAMWYSDGSGSAFLVTSTDGVTWGTPATMAGLTNVHHVQVVYDANCFGTLPCNAGTTKYRIWFWDMGAPTPPYGISNLATAESADGINWINKTSATQNPAAKLVQDPDSGLGWNRGTYGPINIFYQPSAADTGTNPWNYKYVMYYDGTDGAHEDAGLAYSTDGLNWSAYTANPVLSGSSAGSWDCYSSAYGTIYKDSMGFHYFYSGKGRDDGSGNCIDTASNNFDGIGYAFSTDGETWVKDAKPIFHVSDGVPYRSGRIYTPSVINDGSGILRMYFSATDSTDTPKKIGYATAVPPAVLHVVKNVVGGTASASAFNLHVKLAGNNITGSPAAGAAAPGTSYFLSAGTYVTSEDAHASYTTSFSVNCDSGGSITLSAGDNKTCMVTNTYVAPGGGGGGTIYTYNITASAGANGSISPSGSISLGYGSSQAFTITPGTGYQVANVLVDGNSAGAVTTYTFSNIAGNHTISATFSVAGTPVTNFPEGCTSNSGYSITTGLPCATTTTLPQGCTSTSGYSITTGLPCSGTGTVPTPSVCGPYMTKYIKLGDVNDPVEVAKLQMFLINYEGFTNLSVTGIYDQITYNAVKTFQLKYAADILAPWGDTIPTGYVYTATIKKINEIYCQVQPGNQPSNVSNVFTQPLSFGSNGPQVTLLQDTLKKLGFFPQSVASNGNFGPTTLKAVQDFQIYYNIAKPGDVGYGQVGPNTRRKLNQLINQ